MMNWKFSQLATYIDILLISACFVFYNKLLPRIFYEYFVRQNVVHTYGIRNAHLYRLPIYKNSCGRIRIYYCGMKV